MKKNETGSRVQMKLIDTTLRHAHTELENNSSTAQKLIRTYHILATRNSMLLHAKMFPHD